MVRFTRPGLALVAVVLTGSAVAAAEAPGPDRVVVQLDKAKLVKLPAHAETIVVGNPSIADVTLMKHNGLMVVTGKGFGETNVIFVDATGQAVSEATVTVAAGQSAMTVQRGMERESYSCTPRCEPTVALGDDAKFMAETSSQITSRNALVVSSQAQR